MLARLFSVYRCRKIKKALIEQLGDEISNEIESIKGAITRSGKENAEQKFMEIMQERMLKRQSQDPYNEK